MAVESESDTDRPTSAHSPAATASTRNIYSAFSSHATRETAAATGARSDPIRKRLAVDLDDDDRRRQRKESINYPSEETSTGAADSCVVAPKVAVPRFKTIPRKPRKLQPPPHQVPIRPAPSRQRNLLPNDDKVNPDSSIPFVYTVRTPIRSAIPVSSAPTYTTLTSPNYTGQPVTIIPGLATALAAIQHNVYERKPIREEYVSSRVVTDPSSPKNGEDQGSETPNESSFYTLMEDPSRNVVVRSNPHLEPQITRIIARPTIHALAATSPVDAYVRDGIRRFTERLRVRQSELGAIMFNALNPMITEYLAELLVEAYKIQNTSSSSSLQQAHPDDSSRISELQNHIAEIELENKNLGDQNKQILVLEEDNARLKEKVAELEWHNALLKEMVDVKVPQMEEQIRLMKSLKGGAHSSIVSTSP
ncbi:hypothetical protein BJ742DRAFT_819142 [Cladochytrium replicatum]|nr:hypothetical protein BJ742DRAFT_819142 [Cladochytrium replicatum]